jgi:hypothetical protein
MQALSFWDDIQLIIPFILGVLFFRFCIPRRPASGFETADVVKTQFSKKEMFDDDDELVSTTAGSDTDEQSEDLSASSSSVSAILVETR